MRLDEWVTTKGAGEITRLQTATGLSYAAVHNAVRGKTETTYKTAMRIAAATGGMVTAAEICDPLARMARARSAPRKKPKRKAGKKPGKRRSVEAQPKAAAAVA